MGLRRRGKYKFQTRPYRHQVKALRKLLRNGSGALFMDMGTGKSKVAIDFANCLYLRDGIKKAVVVCPKSVKSVWRIEIPKHTPAKLRGKIEWKIVSYDELIDIERYDEENEESVIYEGEVHEIVEWIADGKALVVGDESHKFKSPGARRTKAMMRLGRTAKHKVAQTGTFAPRSPLDLFAQYKFIHEGILGSDFNNFKKKIAVWGGYGGYTLLRYINLKWLKRRVAHCTFMVKKDDCLDLPSRTHEIVPVDLGPTARKIYNSMATDAIAEFEGEELVGDLPIVRVLRLLQIAQGHFRTEDGWKRIDHAKLEMCHGLCSDLYENERKKIVIFANEKYDLKDAAYAAKLAGYNILLFHGKTPEHKREQKLAEFDETDKYTAFVAQVDTGSLGISLTAASEAICYSWSRKGESFSQAPDRLHRIGQHHPVTYYHLLTRGTVDETNLLGLKTKKKVEDLCLRRPELLMGVEGLKL